MTTSASVVLLLGLAFALPATRPWAKDDVEWFEISALLEAVLLGALVLALV